MRTIQCLLTVMLLAAPGCVPMADTRDAADDHEAALPDAPRDAPRDASPDASADAAMPSDAPFVPAAHANPTPLVSHGGPVFAQPRIVTITYANEPNREAIERFSA